MARDTGLDTHSEVNMQGMLRSFQETLVRGVLWLAPLLLFGMLVAKALGFLRKLTDPLAGDMGPLAGIPAPMLVATLALVGLCLLAGLLARTAGARGLVSWLEAAVLLRLPGYAYMKGMGENMAGVRGRTEYQPVLARIEESWQLGYIVETIEPGQYAVYVPGAPNPWSGAVYFMAEDRIRKVDLKLGEVQGCLKSLGIGSSAILKGKL